MLQNVTTDCNEDCKCTDFMKVTMGGNELKLCGSRRPDISNQMSSDGLKFCSDNAISSRGVLVMAYHYKEGGNSSFDLTTVINSRKKRQVSSVLKPIPVVIHSVQQTPETCEERMNEMSTEMGRMGCQYEYMMRVTP